MIEHEPPECIPRDEFPILTADIQPPEGVQAARLYFRAEQHADLYFVDMPISPEDGNFFAILPQALPETDFIHYYVEAIDPTFEAVRTEEFIVELDTADECRRRGGAIWFTGTSPGIVVNGVAQGAPAIPAGFQAAGIAAFVSSAGVVTAVTAAGASAGGGLAAGGVILVVAGGTAATAGLVTAATGDEEASPVDP